MTDVLEIVIIELPKYLKYAKKEKIILKDKDANVISRGGNNVK